MSIQEVALAAHLARDIPEGMEPGMSATHFFEPSNFTFPFGSHVAVVEIDKETGQVKFLRYIAVDDVEDLTTELSQKIWQKITLLDTLKLQSNSPKPKG